jgi:hypothetical protein
MAPGAAYATGAAPAAASTATSSSKSVIGGIITIIGAALTIFGVFSGWVELGDTGTVSGWSLTEGEGLLKSNDPYLLVGLAVVALVGGLLLLVGVARTLVRIAVILLGLTIVAITVLNWLSIASFIEDNLPSSFEATAGIGFYLAIAGGVLAAIGGLIPAGKK